MKFGLVGPTTVGEDVGDRHQFVDRLRTTEEDRFGDVRVDRGRAHDRCEMIQQGDVGNAPCPPPLVIGWRDGCGENPPILR